MTDTGRPADGPAGELNPAGGAADNWHPAGGLALDAATAAQIARQAATFLAATVHDEVDNARVGVTHVLASADGSHVYAGAVVQGPLRCYQATAWGPAGHAGRKEIVSYPDPAAAQAALDATLAHQMKQGYTPLGTVDGEA